MISQLPPPRQLVACEAAARHESFLAATAALDLTPSAISHQVRNLETCFGRRLSTGLVTFASWIGQELARPLAIA